MTLQIERKLKKLVEQWPVGTVATSLWFQKLNISRQLVQHYIHSGWIEPLGRGAYKRAHDKIEWYGALASLQKQTGLSVHAGGPTALSLRGVSHYLRMGKEKIFLFSDPKASLPKWFGDYNWGQPLEHIKTSILPSELAIKDYVYQGIEIKISSPERAVLECLYLTPQKFDLVECYQIIEGLVNLRPHILQELLAKCTSIRVKRSFLYMAEKAKLPVLEHLKLDTISLGKGDRSIVKKGVYNSKYGISLPRELVDYV